MLADGRLQARAYASACLRRLLIHTLPSASARPQAETPAERIARIRYADAARKRAVSGALPRLAQARVRFRPPACRARRLTRTSPPPRPLLLRSPQRRAAANPAAAKKASKKAMPKGAPKTKAKSATPKGGR